LLKVYDLSLEKAIIHRLDNQNNYPNGLELSELELELNTELQEVIETHTKSGLEDARIRYANFNDPANNNVNKNCEFIFNDNETFIENSIALARSLFQTMGNQNISAADLVICLFVCNNKYLIGMLKLDYKDQYISETSIKDGKRYISIKRLEKGWPELGRRLQKAAFVLKKESGEGQYDLIVLDRQMSKKDENENTNTKSFIRGAKKIFEEYEQISVAKRKEIYESAINLVVSSENINVKTFAESHFDIERPEDVIHGALAEEVNKDKYEEELSLKKCAFFIVKYKKHRKTRCN
jgi:hypothetical protein